MTNSELIDNSSLLIIAGSETTATTLSGATYLLTTHPEVLARLSKEVRSTYSSEAEIDLLSVQKLSYMLAVLDETLRIYPPVPTAIPRITQPGGDVVCGKYMPEGVSRPKICLAKGQLTLFTDSFGYMAMANVPQCQQLRHAGIVHP